MSGGGPADAGVLPAGSWTHSFEEDADGVEVYRPTASFAFPPSRRGRAVLEFSGNTGRPASLTTIDAGPDDRPRMASAGLLVPLGGGRHALESAPGKRQTVLEIIEATPAILRLVRR